MSSQDLPSRILIVRTSAMGDVVHCLPVLRYLRRTLPEVPIGWVVEEVWAPIVADHADLDRVFPVRAKHWRNRPLSARTRRELATLRRDLRAFDADLALDLMGNHKGALLARLSGARRIVGLGRRQRREGSSALWIHQGVETQAIHAVDRFLDIARQAVGSPLAPSDGEVAFAADTIFPSAAPPAAGSEVPAEFILIQPGAGWGSKTYPPELWGEVAAGLHEATGLPSLAAVAPGEEQLAQRVAVASRGAARTVPAHGLAALAALLRRARLVLGGDTGPVHMAHALGTPVLMLLGPTDPARHGPWQAAERAHFVRLPCSFCHRRFDEAKACMLSLRPASVVERARGLLASGP